MVFGFLYYAQLINYSLKGETIIVFYKKIFVCYFTGTRAPINNYKKCSMGKVKANAIITRGGEAYNQTEIMAFTNLFMAAQQLYGRKTNDEFT